MVYDPSVHNQNANEMKINTHRRAPPDSHTALVRWKSIYSVCRCVCVCVWAVSVFARKIQSSTLSNVNYSNERAHMRTMTSEYINPSKCDDVCCVFVSVWDSVWYVADGGRMVENKQTIYVQLIDSLVNIACRLKSKNRLDHNVH